MSRNLPPELQALVDARESSYPIPKYYLGEKEVKVMRLKDMSGRSESGFFWVPITDQLLENQNIKYITRVPPVTTADLFA